MESPGNAAGDAKTREYEDDRAQRKGRGLGRHHHRHHHVLFLDGKDYDEAQHGEFQSNGSVIANAASKVPWAIVAVSVAQIMVEMILSREQKLELALFKT